MQRGALTRSVAEFLRACVLNRRNILASGGTGETALLSDLIPSSERMIAVEVTAELQLNKAHEKGVAWVTSRSYVPIASCRDYRFENLSRIMYMFSDPKFIGKAV